MRIDWLTVILGAVLLAFFLVLLGLILMRKHDPLIDPAKIAKSNSRLSIHVTRVKLNPKLQSLERHQSPLTQYPCECMCNNE